MGPPSRTARSSASSTPCSAEPDGTATVALVNDTLGLGVYQLYDSRAMPFHTVWRMMGEGTYAVALEPTTNRGRRPVRCQGAGRAAMAAAQ